MGSLVGGTALLAFGAAAGCEGDAPGPFPSVREGWPSARPARGGGACARLAFASALPPPELARPSGHPGRTVP